LNSFYINHIGIISLTDFRSAIDCTNSICNQPFNNYGDLDDYKPPELK